MRQERGCQRIGGVGYCYRGKYAARYLKPGLWDVSYMAHPTHVEVKELKGIQGPLSISAASSGYLFPTEKRRESEDILSELGYPYEVTVFSYVERGYAVRCNMDVKEQSSQGEESRPGSWLVRCLFEGARCWELRAKRTMGFLSILLQQAGTY
ncbi:hypothetical protein ASPBRDRAFT_324203 [Aspergillus brasiliensis CBS 101740]|uniref:Dienelactone hydrolase domain-containing protein n=1 Tax=Aspergillus brasiliensis (strain CBS 101740 / IMI 381727 / IBT 21946) TaxID=767769 RepID=A0A1L9U9H1_ASPBC|nr:hypothetical protein ASPBRDRAFT_324203 [Aspergillus brasiliensis CBS 101740]